MRVMKASVKGRYELEKSSAVATLAFKAGDVCLKASLTDATFTKGPSLSGLALSLDKPGAFLIDYNVPKNDIRFQFMNSVRVMEKQVNLTYTHAYGDRRTAVDAAVVFDLANKVSASYDFGSGDSKVKYVYAHGEARRTVLEPTYDVAKNSWDLAVTRKFDAGNLVRATYGTSSKVLGLEWNRDSKFTGCFKISASVNLAEQNIVPRVAAESTWNLIR